MTVAHIQVGRKVSAEGGIRKSTHVSSVRRKLKIMKTAIKLIIVGTERKRKQDNTVLSCC